MIKLNTTLIRPPIVAVLGHVDHGKTTLLDSIRKSQTALTEHGGITQHIGAYQITSPEGAKITFIDTPGHEIFAKMRSLGSEVADIALLVVSAVDGVMPQTIESINLIKKAGIPFIVVMNKIDLPNADPETIKQQLAKHEVLVEGFGGDIVLLPVSAKTGKGIAQLLEMILLVTELKGLRKNEPQELGVVIEARLDKHIGILATVICTAPKLMIGQNLYTYQSQAKIRAMISDLGKHVQSVVAGQPVEIMGWDKLPAIGSTVYSQDAKINSAIEHIEEKQIGLIPITAQKKLKVILKADVAGSLGAIIEKLAETVDLVLAETGAVSESDVLTAKSVGALIIGFNVKVSNGVKKLIQIEHVKVKTYTIIYTLLDEIREVTELLNSPTSREDVLGEAEILAEFQSGDIKIAGCKVKSGRIVRGDLIMLMRKQLELGRTKIKSLKFKKEDIPKAEAGTVCGILFDKQLDFKTGDLIISYKIHDLLA